MIVSANDTVIDLFGDDLLIFFHTKDGSPSDEMEGYFSFADADLARFRRCRSLVFSDGGGPSAKQRQRVKLYADGVQAQRVAILSRSNILRFIAAAVSVFLPNLKVFEPENFANALAFLSFPQSDLPALIAKIEAMRAASGDATRFKTLNEVMSSVSPGKAAPLA